MVIPNEWVAYLVGSGFVGGVSGWVMRSFKRELKSETCLFHAEIEKNKLESFKHEHERISEQEEKTNAVSVVIERLTGTISSLDKHVAELAIVTNNLKETSIDRFRRIEEDVKSIWAKIDKTEEGRNV